MGMLGLQNVRPQPELSGPPKEASWWGVWGGGTTKMAPEAAEGVLRVGKMSSKTILTTRQRAKQRRKGKRDREGVPGLKADRQLSPWDFSWFKVSSITLPHVCLPLEKWGQVFPQNQELHINCQWVSFP